MKIESHPDPNTVIVSVGGDKFKISDSPDFGDAFSEMKRAVGEADESRKDPRAKLDRENLARVRGFTELAEAEKFLSLRPSAHYNSDGSGCDPSNGLSWVTVKGHLLIAVTVGEKVVCSVIPPLKNSEIDLGNSESLEKICDFIATAMWSVRDRESNKKYRNSNLTREQKALKKAEKAFLSKVRVCHLTDQV